jgi:hypothetical protein
MGVLSEYLNKFYTGRNTLYEETKEYMKGLMMLYCFEVIDVNVTMEALDRWCMLKEMALQIIKEMERKINSNVPIRWKDENVESVTTEKSITLWEYYLTRGWTQ